MIDAWIRPKIDPPLNKMGSLLAQSGLHPNTVTILGFAIGILTIPLIAQGFFWAAFAALLVNRLLDGLDGAVARARHLSDLGGFLDIVSDFIVYSSIPFAFALYDPVYGVWSSFLIFSFMGATSSFLAYAIMSAKQEKKPCAKRGKKSFHYLGGLSEGFETFVALSIVCLFPWTFPTVALVYGIMCWLTTLGRVGEAYKTL